MKNPTREKFNSYLAQQAALSGVNDATKKFNIAPSVQQKLEKRVQESSAFLKKIHIVPVDELKPDGTYISPAIATNGGTELRVIYEADLPSGSACAVHMQVDGQSNWVQVPIDAAASGTNNVGVIEIHHKLTGVNAAALRVRLTPAGTPTARPYVRNLRAVVLP